MLRIFVLTLCFAFTTTTAFSNEQASVADHLQTQTESAHASTFWNSIGRLRTNDAVIWSAACCKVCRKGKACGNSCISRSYQCHKGRGCACDG